jgi:hypothetical protein
MKPRRPLRSRGPAAAAIGMRDLGSQLFGRHPEHVLALLRAAWPGAVGPELARRTEVLALEGRTLRVRVPDAGWRKVIHRMRREIMGRLWATAGSLAPTALGLQEGEIRTPSAVPATLPSPSPSAPTPSEAPGEAPASLQAAAAAIDDPELRALFLASAAAYLTRRGLDA